MLVALAVGLPTALAGSAGDPGITNDSILLGATVPLSGDEVAYAAVARGANAYFQYVNDHGGVRGRKVRYLFVDDAYDPSETVRKTRELVENDKVFAIFGSVGTEHVLAVRPYLNQLGIPQLFVGSGLSALALERRRYPWSMGFLPRFAGEGALYGRYVKRTRPRSRIAVLREDSEYGEDMISAFWKSWIDSYPQVAIDVRSAPIRLSVPSFSVAGPVTISSSVATWSVWTRAPRGRLAWNVAMPQW